MTERIFLAAATMLILGIGPAFADQGQAMHPNTWFADIPGELAHSARHTGPLPVVSHPNKHEWYYSEDLEQYAFAPRYTHLYFTQSNPGTWLFPPDPNQGAGS